MLRYQKKIVAVFFLLLVTLKVARWVLFDSGNPTSGLLFAVSPYALFGFLVVTFSKRIQLAVLTGFAILSADLGLDYLFRNSTDAQTPISIAYNYLICLFFILVTFLTLNQLIKASPVIPE